MRDTDEIWQTANAAHALVRRLQSGEPPENLVVTAGHIWSGLAGLRLILETLPEPQRATAAAAISDAAIDLSWVLNGGRGPESLRTALNLP